MDQLVYQRMASHEETHWWFVARRNIITRLIRLFVSDEKQQGLRILEVGCGTGGNLAMLQQFGTVRATECDATARSLAMEKSGIDVQDGRLPELDDLAEDDFDLIVLLDVLEHVEDDHSALRALAGRHAGNGKLLVTVPAHPWLWSAHDETHHHFRRYTKSTLRAVAERAGYRVEELGYYNSLLFPLAVFIRFVKKLLGRDTADDAMPGPAVNTILKTVFSMERGVIGRVPMPTGLSLYMVARPLERHVRPV